MAARKIPFRDRDEMENALLDAAIPGPER